MSVLQPSIARDLAAQGDVGTTVVTAIGAALLVVLGIRIAYLAVRTRASVTPAQAALWEYFGYAGALALLYGSLSLLGLRTGGPLVVLDGLLLAFALAVAFALREAYYNATLSNAEVDRLGQYRLRRTLEFGFVVAVLVRSVGPLVRPDPVFDVLAGVAGTAVVAYGGFFHLRRIATVRTRGTLIDSITRQSLPVLAFAGAAVAAPALSLASVPATVVRALAAALVLAAATSLLAVAIKLGQHSASHR